MRIELISGIGALHARHAAWDDLWRRSAVPTPFQSAAWVLSWARHFAPERTHALVAHRDGAWLACVPFFSWEGKLLLAGTGPSDYGDGLFAPGAPALPATMLERLCAAAVELDCRCVDLQQLCEGSPLLHAPVPRGWRDEIVPGTACPVAPIRGEDGLEAVSPHWRKNARRAERLLRREYPVELDCVGDEEIEHAAHELERLHGQRWSARDRSHAFADPLMRAFLHEAVPALAAHGLLRLLRLRVRGESAAMVFAMSGRGAHYYYLSGFDPHWSRYSTGLVTILAAMRSAAREQATAFHFLRGGEAYKYHLGAEDLPTFRRVLRPAVHAH